jgi:hypothetical protein
LQHTIPILKIQKSLKVRSKQASQEDGYRERQTSILGPLALGALIPAMLGISSSLFAIHHVEIEIASTMMVLTSVQFGVGASANFS